MFEGKERVRSAWFYLNQIRFKMMSHFETDIILKDWLPTARLGIALGYTHGNLLHTHSHPCIPSRPINDPVV